MRVHEEGNMRVHGEVGITQLAPRSAGMVQQQLRPCPLRSSLCRGVCCAWRCTNNANRSTGRVQETQAVIQA